MGDLGFGSSFNMLESGEEHWAIKLLNEGMDPVGFSFPVWFFRTLITIPGLAAGYFKFIAFCQQQIENRVQRQGKQDVKDIAHYLVDDYQNAQDKKTALHQLHADSRLIIVAGSDTTAATLTHLFYHLAGDSSIQHRLREELEPKIEDGDMTNIKIQDSPYLNGCIHEALRLNPPVPSGIFRKTPKEGVNIGDTYIPGDTTIQMPGFVLGHGMHFPFISHLYNLLITSQTMKSILPPNNSSQSAGPHDQISSITKMLSNLSRAVPSVALVKTSP